MKPDLEGGAPEIARLRAQLDDMRVRRDELLTILGHELRNPLAAMTVAAELLAAPGAPEAQQASAQAVLARQTRHLAVVVDELLSLAELTQGDLVLQREVVQLDELAARAVADARLEAENRGQSLGCDVLAKPIVSGDARRLGQLLGELLRHASNQSPRGGRIGVLVDEIAGEPVVAVSDSGPGLTPEAIASLFEPGARPSSGANTDHAHRPAGLGLGLSFVRRLADLHGAKVQVTSQLGAGSVFSIVFPNAFAGSRRAELAAPTPDTPPARRILLIDDNDDVLEMMGLILGRWGHEVHTAENGKEGVARAVELRPDLVLLDIGLPDIDGHEVARRLRADARTATIRIVAMTGHGLDRDREASRQAGCDEHLVKPVEPAQLAAEIDRFGA